LAHARLKHNPKTDKQSTEYKHIMVNDQRIHKPQQFQPNFHLFIKKIKLQSNGSK